MYGVVLHAHPVSGESHNQRNTTGEVATVWSKYQGRFGQASWMQLKPAPASLSPYYPYINTATVSAFTWISVAPELYTNRQDHSITAWFPINYIGKVFNVLFLGDSILARLLLDISPEPKLVAWWRMWCNSLASPYFAMKFTSSSSKSGKFQ